MERERFTPRNEAKSITCGYFLGWGTPKKKSVPDRGSICIRCDQQGMENLLRLHQKEETDNQGYPESTYVCKLQ